MDKKRIALVNQRFGLEVNGGSEYYTRLIATMLQAHYEVEILTTTALDYNTWDNYYPEGLSEVEGIKVRRFRVHHKRSRYVFGILSRIIKYTKCSLFENAWINAQGPLSYGLIRYIEENRNKYDSFIFVTYLYYHTVKGLPKVADKAILIPTAHDEPFINYKVYRKIFKSPRAIIYLTDEERSFVQGTFQNDNIHSDVIGIGVDVPDYINPDNFRNKYGITGQYFIYVGRIDTEKGCKVLFDYYSSFMEDNKEIDVKLVLVGKQMMEIPKDKNIISAGFVNEEDKFDAIAGSLALILPSEYESLSISVLEAMALSVPVMVNGNCAVLKAHCDKSQGGLYFRNYEEFEADMKVLLKSSSEEYRNLKQNARAYIEENYTWDACRNKFDQILQ